MRKNKREQHKPTNKRWIISNPPSAVDIVEGKQEANEYCKKVLKTLFDWQSREPYRSPVLGPIAQLHVQGFQVEQIWEELQLRNRPLLRFVTKKLQQLETSWKESVKQDQQSIQNDQVDKDLEAVEDNRHSDEEVQVEEEVDTVELSHQKDKNDEEDKFFSYEALAEAADREEEDNMVDEEDREDSWQEELYHELQGETEEQEAYYYEKFFDESHSTKTTNQKVSDPLEEKIKQLEEKQIGDKHWSMLGEVRASQRPVNSALDIELDFDSAMRQRNVMQKDEEENATNSLEERIKHRIAESAFDDVIRTKLAETSKPATVEISQEKDRRGLSELYEEQYLEQAQDKRHDKRYDEIDHLFRELTKKLDALSNFHYTPRPAPPELKVIPSNLPSIVAEEAVPEVLGDGELLAPEQIYKPTSSIENNTQVTSQDRKKWRRKRKRAGKRAKMRKQWEAKIASQENGVSTKQQRKDAIKTLETLKHTGKHIRIHTKSNDKVNGQVKKKEEKPLGHKIHSSSLKL